MGEATDINLLPIKPTYEIRQQLVPKDRL